MAVTHHPFMTTHYITSMGIADLKQRVKDLDHIRAKIIEEMRELTAQSGAASDLEDASRALHQERVVELDAQIRTIQHIIRTATVLPAPTSNTTVQIGSKVTITMDGLRRTYTIVSSLEADPGQGKISNESPLGSALLGKRVNDHLKLSLAPKKGCEATVVAIQ